MIDEVFKIAFNKIKDMDIKNHAMNVNVLFKDRNRLYLKDQSHMRMLINKIVQKVYQKESPNVASFETPILDNIREMGKITNLIENFFFMVIFFLCVISFILIYSLMQSDVEERTYEFAMLRTMGMRNRNLMVILTIQATLFSIPGLLLGMLINFVL